MATPQNICCWVRSQSVAAVVGLALSQGAIAQMSVGGSFGVSPTGAATYTIPIALPGGVAGMEPKLALSYSSQSGNGLLGVGWSLSGLSAVSRCPRTMLQDNVVGRVGFDGNDRYCLDGQRLILISGTEGGNGAVYRTEADGASKIVAYSETDATGGPGSFIVWTKAGLKMEYGKTTDSRIEAQGKTVVATWALNKVTDTKGNYFTVSYTEDNVNGQYYPAHIDYTANSGVPAKTIVYFDHGTRTDISNRYYQDSLSRLTAIMQRVRVVDVDTAQTILSYELDYSPASDSKASQLIKVRRCAGSVSSCLPPITLTYDTAAVAPVSMTMSAHGVGDQGWQVADIFGDGRQVYWTHNGSGQHFASRINEDGTVQNWTWSGGHGVGNGGWRLVDLFGDGRPVYWSRQDGQHYVTRLNSDGTLQNWTFNGHGEAEGGIDFADIFGDGRKVYYTHDGYGQHFATRFNPDGTSQNWTWAGGHGLGPKWKMADLFGNGRQVYWTTWDDGIHRATQLNEDGTLQNWSWSGGHGGGDAGWDLADLFGDGRQVYWTHWGNGTHGATRLNSDGTSKTWTWSGGHGVGNGNWRLAEIYGDGRKYYWSRQDLQHYVTRLNADGTLQNFTFQGQGEGDSGWDFVRVLGDGREVYWTHNGSGGHFFTRFDLDGTVNNFSFFGHGVGTDGAQVVDLSGTGQFNYWTHSNFTHYVTRFVSGYSGLLKSVNNGVGSTISVSMDTLPRLYGTRYFNSAVVSYPKSRMFSPLPVVKTVTGSDGVGATRDTAYWYGDGVQEVGLKGRGFLGFAWTQQKDVATGLVGRTYYRQDFPLIGTPYRTARGTSEADWSSLELVDTLYSFIALTAADVATTCTDSAVGAPSTCSSAAVAPGKRYVVYPAQVDTQGKDLDSTPMPRTRVINQGVDKYGNVGTVITQTLSPSGATADFTKTVTNTYATSDTTNWILGRLLTSKVDATTTATLPASVTPGSGGLAAAAPPKLPTQVLLPILSLLLDD